MKTSSPAWKSFFLGPASENAPWVRRLTIQIFSHWFKWRRDIFSEDGFVVTDDDKQHEDFIASRKRIGVALDELLDRFNSEVPTFTPRYVGHMKSEISVPALLGHIVTLLYNPNNITDEVSKVGSQIEHEALQAVAKMLGYDPKSVRGHFTSGGTVANIEGLVRARARMCRWLALVTATKLRDPDVVGSLFEAAHIGWDRFDTLTQIASEGDAKKYHLLHGNPFEVAQIYEKVFGVPYKGPVVLVPSSKHYSWPKAALLLGFGRESFWSVPLNEKGQLSVRALHKLIEKARGENRPIAAVISVAGTTELGSIDPIERVDQLLDQYQSEEGIDIYHHVDAAYGGFFCTLPKDKELLSAYGYAALDAIRHANSLTVDPHKLGFVPYASGTFLCREAREYYVTPFDAPYLRFEQKKEGGTQTLEGSRSAGGAVATWLTARSIGLDKDGYGEIIARNIRLRRDFEEKLVNFRRTARIAPYSETDILCFCIAQENELLSVTNKRTEKIHARLKVLDSEHPFAVSRTELSFDAYEKFLKGFTNTWRGEIDTDGLVLLRLTFMNPFFEGGEQSVDYAQELIRYLEEIL